MLEERTPNLFPNEQPKHVRNKIPPYISSPD